MESLEHAQKRGATILAEYLGGEQAPSSCMPALCWTLPLSGCVDYHDLTGGSLNAVRGTPVLLCSLTPPGGLTCRCRRGDVRCAPHD